MSRRPTTYGRLTVILLALMMTTGCSTQKNTPASRRHHALTTRYNVRFNAEQFYLKGVEQTEKAYREDFSELLPVYIISAPAMQQTAAGQMKSCIGKCEQAIKTHSIRVKPEKKPGRNASAKDKAFYEQEEFNPVMPSVFLLMAKAQFYQGDFMSALSTATYIQQHFSHDRKVSDAARLLQARAYYFSDWMYEAENIFVKMNEEGFDPSLTADYSMAYADLLLRRGETEEAIPLLEIALSNLRHKYDKQRINYLLAQLYQLQGHDERALKYYKAVCRLNPPYEMDLNARIRQTEVDHRGGEHSQLNKLTRLSRNPNNADYLDAIHYAIGNVLLARRDTAGAIEHYRSAIQKSTKNGLYKAQALLKLGGLYYDREEFRPAVPLYEEGNRLLKKEHSLKELAAERDRILQRLAPHVETVFVQDSLQAMAALPEERRNAIIDSIIVEVKKRLKEEQRQQDMEEALSANEAFTQAGRQEADEPSAALTVGDDSWYFYNENSLKQGRKAFEKAWGRRALEDNWRIKNKGSFFTDLAAQNGENAAAADSLALPALDGAAENDTPAAVEVPDFELSDDPTEPGYYLHDLPFTPEQIEASDALIAEALFNEAKIFREEMENDALALRTFALLESRFPADSLWLPESYYLCYLILMQHHEGARAETDRQKLLSRFPDSEQAALLADPLFLQRLQEMYATEDSLYSETYHHFLENHSDTVKANCDYVEAHYQRSALRPNFMFLRALEAVKDGDGELFLSLITSIATEFPGHTLQETASKMVGYWNAGLRPQGFDGFYEGYVDIDSVMVDSIANSFVYDPAEAHYLVLTYPADSVNANRLLFDVALYNFTNFLIRDYELSLERVADMDALVIRSFENAEDVSRYSSWMNFQTEAPEAKYPGLRRILISESNFNLINTISFGDKISPSEVYDRFYRRAYLGQEEEEE